MAHSKNNRLCNSSQFHNYLLQYLRLRNQTWGLVRARKEKLVEITPGNGWMDRQHVDLRNVVWGLCTVSSTGGKYSCIKID